MPSKYYLTTAIDYLNAPPHLGHAYEKVAADAIARFHRLRGEEVFFLTGSDEHGTKIEKTAENQGLTPKEHVDATVEKFKEAWGALNVSYDGFVRTTDEDHEKVVQHIFQTLLSKGDIFKAKYEGWYCKGCEEYKNERDLVDGCCTTHQSKADWFSEENYVFKISNYRDRLKKHIEDHPEFIQPEFRQKEILNSLETFPDISVSRQSVKWGIPVPGDPNQVIYVWLDALSNYLTGVGYLSNDETFRKWWPADLHLVGKDITKFHAIIWPIILMAMDLPLPRTIYGHGFVNIGSQKISKSLGNVVDPKGMADEFGADAIRYYLLREIPFGKDGDFSQEAFEHRINADLANNLGNALNRTLPILEKNFEGKVSKGSEVGESLEVLSRSVIDDVSVLMEEFRINEAIARIWDLLDGVNKFIDTAAPWALAKDPNKKDELAGVLYAALESLRIAAILASPFIPTLSAKIWEQLGITDSLAEQKWEQLAWGKLPVGTLTRRLGPIYPRIGAELAGKAKKG